MSCSLPHVGPNEWLSALAYWITCVRLHAQLEERNPIIPICTCTLNQQCDVPFALLFSEVIVLDFLQQKNLFLNKRKKTLDKYFCYHSCLVAEGIFLTDKSLITAIQEELL